MNEAVTNMAKTNCFSMGVTIGDQNCLHCISHAYNHVIFTVEKIYIDDMLRKLNEGYNKLDRTINKSKTVYLTVGNKDEALQMKTQIIN